MSFSFNSLAGRVGAVTTGFAVAIAMAGLAIPAAQGQESGETQSGPTCLPLDRLGGKNAIETSSLVAARAYPAGSPDFMVASTRNPVDALPGGALGIGPVLLTDGFNWDLNALINLSTAHILGGPGAVPASAEMFFDEHGIEHSRLQGADRNATAAAIADAWVEAHGQPTFVYVTRNAGSGSPDAVAASVVRDGPILTFTSPASLQAAAAKIQELNPSNGVVILGGTGVVSAAEAKTLAGGLPVDRLSGANRYETSRMIAKWVMKSRPVKHIYLASGNALKDAMVAGSFNDGVIVLTPPNAAGINGWARTMNADGITVIGGKGVVSDATAKIAACGEAPGITAAQVKNLLYPFGGDPACSTATWDAAETVGMMEMMHQSADACWGDTTGTQVSIKYSGDYSRDGYNDAIVYVSDGDGTMIFLVVYNRDNPSRPYVSHLWGGNGDWGFRVVEKSSFTMFELLANNTVVNQLSVTEVDGHPEVARPVS